MRSNDPHILAQGHFSTGPHAMSKLTFTRRWAMTREQWRLWTVSGVQWRTTTGGQLWQQRRKEQEAAEPSDNVFCLN
jgi:hypothetical protein